MIPTNFHYPQPGSTSVGGVEYSIGSTELNLTISNNNISIKCNNNFILQARLRTGMQGLAYTVSDINSDKPLIVRVYGIRK